MFPTQQDILKIVSFKTSRSGGAGGQHVNKVSSKVELIFDLNAAHFFTDLQKDLIRENLKSKFDAEGLLHVVSQEDRSQLLNKQRTVVKLQMLLKKALEIKKERKASKATKASKERRLAAKEILSKKKADRRKLDF